MSEQEIENEIVEKKLTAPRLTPSEIDASIADCYYFTAENGVSAAQEDMTILAGYHSQLKLLTFCVVILRNGYMVTGESACASPENFDAEIGGKIARENARNKIWALEGYLLKERLFQAQ